MVKVVFNFNSWSNRFNRCWFPVDCFLITCKQLKIRWIINKQRLIILNLDLNLSSPFLKVFYSQKFELGRAPSTDAMFCLTVTYFLWHYMFWKHFWAGKIIGSVHFPIENMNQACFSNFILFRIIINRRRIDCWNEAFSWKQSTFVQFSVSIFSIEQVSTVLIWFRFLWCYWVNLAAFHSKELRIWWCWNRCSPEKWLVKWWT